MIKNNKGVALATLVIAVIVMLTIIGTITYTSLDTMKLRKLDDMYNDIRLLKQKVTNYHIENNELPILENPIKYEDIIDVVTKEENGVKVKLNPNDDEEKYYIIDLEKLGGVTLKYGKDYEKYKENFADIGNDKDVYIINIKSHTIYYLKGIELKAEGIDVTKYALDENYKEIDMEIDFVIGITTYEATYGMTWSEWIEEYKPMYDNIAINIESEMIRLFEGFYVLDNNEKSYVKPDDYIVEGRVYESQEYGMPF